MTSNPHLKTILACATLACAISLSPAALAQSQVEPQAQESFFSWLFPRLQTQRPVQRVAEIPAREQTAGRRPCPQCKTLLFGVAF